MFFWYVISSNSAKSILGYKMSTWKIGNYSLICRLILGNVFTRGECGRINTFSGGKFKFEYSMQKTES